MIEAMTRREALTAMQGMGTHQYYTPEFAHTIERAFGMKERTQIVAANTGDPKGLMSPEVGPNSPLEGYSSHDLAQAICRHLNLKYESFFGRGSQQRACEKVIDEYLIGKGE